MPTINSEKKNKQQKYSNINFYKYLYNLGEPRYKRLTYLTPEAIDELDSYSSTDNNVEKQRIRRFAQRLRDANL
jgi:hypothetical protein